MGSTDNEVRIKSLSGFFIACGRKDIIMKVFFTADTHFGHERTLQLSKRPFDTVLEMDTAIIDSWHNLITPADTVYHLGDFGNPEMIHSLDGNILFLPGNYDDSMIISILASSCTLIKSNIRIEAGGLTFRLIHEPDEVRGVTGSFFLFAHIHKLQMVKRNGLNVGVDCHDFCPISLETVLFYRNAIENHYDENVFLDQIG